MKRFALMVFSSVLAMEITSDARAQVIVDMRKITCEQLLTASPDAVDTAVWLSGYYNGLRKNTQLDLAQFKKNAESVVAGCQANPKKTVMEQIELMPSVKK